MDIRRVVAPLVRRSTFRRGVHLLLGGVILIPYVLLTVGFVQIFAEPDVPYGPMIALVVVTLVIAAIPPFLPATRNLEISASRSLLGVDLPEPADDPPWEARLLGAGWYAVHLICGGLTLLAILIAAPMAVLLTAAALGGDDGWTDTVSLTPFDNLSTPWALVVSVGLIVATGYVVAAFGALLAKLAPLLLGPTPAELQAALDAQATKFAERNRLARDLHDSVGHALTITTLQAAAARRVLESDPDAARRALESVENTGRAALDDLDHVVGLLRERSGERIDAPVDTLAGIDRLVDAMRAAGVEIITTATGDLSAVPPVVSREAFRVVQEGLTNAARHAGQVPVTLTLEARPPKLDIVIANPLPAGESGGNGTRGRGLRGMRERVHLLRGEFEAGSDGNAWRVRVTLPLHTSGASGRSPA